MENELITDSNSSDRNCEVGDSQQTNKSTAEKFVNILFYFSIILFFIGFNFADYSPSGWYQQFLPNLNGQSISDVFFLDSLTGWAVTQSASITDTAYILKTTNGGDNWHIKYRSIDDYSKVMFINLNTGFVSGGDLIKSINGGENWFSVNRPNQTNIEDMFVLNNDTIWLVDNNSLVGGVFFTSNGGLNWSQQFSAGTENPNKIYMYNARIGFICNTANGTSTRKTTDGGNNWFVAATNDAFYDIHFSDSLTGWKAKDNIKKSTDGGLNWIQQELPHGINGQSILGGIRRLADINKDTIWGGGAGVIFPNSQARGILFRATNGGNNWYYQIPDTTIHSGSYTNLQFLNKYIGWAYASSMGIHTVTGGDTTFLSFIHKISSKVPKEYKLYQNYPNPFNSISKIKYKISKSSNIKIKMYDINGKEIKILIDKKQNQGDYEIIFEGGNLSSGIYFYSLFIDGKVMDTKKAILLK